MPADAGGAADGPAGLRGAAHEHPRVRPSARAASLLPTPTPTPHHPRPTSPHNREAEALLQVSLLAARLDSLLACLGTAARQAAVRASIESPFLFSLYNTSSLIHIYACRALQRAHGQAQAVPLLPDPRARTLLPLLKELELQRRHDLHTLREEVEECARALERHKVSSVV